MDTNALTHTYIKIREARSKLKKEWEAQDAELKEKLERLEGEMLRFLHDTQQESARTASGTFYKQEEITPTGSDWDALYRWIVQHDAFDALDKRIKKTFVKTYMDEHDGAIPPGISVFREYVVRVRRS